MSSTTDPKPEGFIYSSIPANKREAISQSAESRVTMTVKSAIQEYLDSYFSPTGKYRPQLSLVAGFSIQYETSLSAPHTDDPSIYELQLNRLYSQMREKFPMILIIDSGFDYIPSGLGGMTSSSVLGRRSSSITMKMDCKVPIKLSIAALDETTCQDIRDLLLLIFGNLTQFNKAYILKSSRPEDKWEIRLPINKFESEGLDKRNITDDKAQLLWTTGLTLVPEFEGTINMVFANQLQPGLHTVQSGFDTQVQTGRIDDYGNIITDTADLVTTITIPETVTLGFPTYLNAPFLPADSALVSDNPRIALVNGYTIIPRRIGVFNLYLQKRNGGEVRQQWVVRVVG